MAPTIPDTVLSVCWNVPGLAKSNVNVLSVEFFVIKLFLVINHAVFYYKLIFKMLRAEGRYLASFNHKFVSQIYHYFIFISLENF